MTLQLVSNNPNPQVLPDFEEAELRIRALSVMGTRFQENSLEAVYTKLTGKAPVSPFTAEQRDALKRVSCVELYSNRSSLREYLDSTLA